MNHNFKTGDRVLFINENDRGTILMFIGNTKVKLLNSNGFEEMIGLKTIHRLNSTSLSQIDPSVLERTLRQ